MLLDKKPNFTFVKIAAEWAREVAPEPGSLGHNEIFHELVKALWRGDFEDEEGENTDLKTPMPPATWPDGRWVDEHHQRTEKPRKIITITRRELLYMLSYDCPPGVTLPPRQRLSPLPNHETGEPPVPWSELKTEIPWGALDALTPDEYSPTFRRKHLEPLTISKEDFRRWCDEQGHQRPRFWFGEQTDAKKLRVSAPLDLYESPVPPLNSVNLTRAERAAATPTKAATNKMFVSLHQVFLDDQLRPATVEESYKLASPIGVGRDRARVLRRGLPPHLKNKRRRPSQK